MLVSGELERQKDTAAGVRGEGDGHDAELEVAQFPGGASNLTYQITVDGKGYVLRRPPFGSEVRSAHDTGREYNLLSRLQPVFLYVP